MSSEIPLIDNIKIVYKQPELDFTLKPGSPTDWELYLEKRWNEVAADLGRCHKYYLILSRIKNIVKSGKVITDKKVEYLFGDKWDDKR